jgi:hypothetical protein
MNNKLAKEESINSLLYSLINNNTNSDDLYSMLKPDTSSDSASTISNGARLHSARIHRTHITKEEVYNVLFK